MLLLISGTDSYLAVQAINSLKGKYLAKNPDGVELIEISGGGTLPNWADLLAVPLFATSRLVIVREAVKLPAAAQESLATFLLTLPPTTVAVVWPAGELKAKTLLHQALSKADKVISAEELSGQKLSSWLRKRAAELGCELDSATGQALLDTFGNDLWALETELRVLASGVKVTPNSKKRLELESFALYRSVQQGRWSQAKEQLKQEFLSGKPIELLIGSIASALRQSNQKESERQAATELLIDIDFALKTGWLDASAAVALLVAHLPNGLSKRVEWEREWEGIGA